VNINNFFVDLFNSIFNKEFSSGFLLGLSAGYFLKKSFKLMLFVIFLLIIGYFLLEHNNTIELDNGTILGSSDTIIELLKEFVKFIYLKVTNIGTEGGVGAVAGFLFGLKIG